MATEVRPWGVVVIGRNEGERLKRCIASVQSGAMPVVYVDSGSTDGSGSWARSQSVDVVDLDLSRPFTAARARNAGFTRLLTLRPDIEFVQFIDGDCEMVEGWLEVARRFLVQHPEVAAACGRRRERFPEASIFNAQCDREWNTPIGEAKACGGDAMFRRTALEQAGGYRSSLIAGEEPELCVRLRAAGWRIWRLDQEMALHDAAILRWGQWWKRTGRTGHAFAEGARLHGAPPERHWVKETWRAIVWGLCLPLAILLSVLAGYPAALFILLAYPMQVLRLALRLGIAKRWAWQESLLLMLARFPEAWGVIRFWFCALTARQDRLIEYK
ncbi:MAG: glycosyltransferase [Pseudomonadota bacterium]